MHHLQIIKSINGKAEYVLLPMAIYKALHQQIDNALKKQEHEDDLITFKPEDYIDNPIALARIKSGITQRELAKYMNMSQAYISKIESKSTITPKLLLKFKTALESLHATKKR